MASFPLLSTGAVAQYPSSKRISFGTSVVRYLDGSEQRFRLQAASVDRWEIQLNQVSEEEVHALERFFESQEGRFGTFFFTDPWTGLEHAECSFDEDDLQMVNENGIRCGTKFIIRKNNA